MPKIMLCEDDDTMRTLLQTLLQIEGYDVIEMGTNDELSKVLDMLHKEEPAMVLLDVTLRQFSGFDLLASIRKDETLKSTRVLMSSGMDHKTRCIDDGADGFLLKPYMPEELINRIHKLLQN